MYQQNMDNQKRSQDTVESNSKKRRANNSDINAKQVGVEKEDWPFEDDWLDEYALKILRKGCPLENTVAFVDGSHVPGILLETQSLYEKGIPFSYLLFK